jgi:LysR family hydrogen peroxide-inducible transcriptional activator
MDFRQLKYFVATADAGTVSRAATRCGIAQPSLSQQLAKLEGSIGMQLFQREGRGMVLTDAGRALLPRARRILAEVEDAEANLVSDVESGHGRLAVGAIPTIAPYLMPAAVGAVLTQRPACEINVREDLTENLIDALLDLEIDAAVIASEPDHDLLDTRTIGTEEMLVAVPSAWQTDPAGVTLADLREQPTVALSEMHCLGRQVDLYCQLRRLKPRIVCRTTQLATVLEFVSLGIGMSIVPAMVARADKGKGRRFVPVRGQKPTRPICVAWRKSRSRPKAAELFVEAIKRAFAAV